MMAAIASFVYVGLKAGQQLNVVHHRIAWVIPTSYGMAACEVFITGYIAVSAVNAVGVWEQAVLAFEIGTGAGLGAVASMLFHKKMRNRKNERGL
jgi:hypothetical protein